jgi:hypothetical protein
LRAGATYTDAYNFNSVLSTAPTIWLDSADMDSLINDSLLNHRTTYYIVGSPRSRFGNWGAVSLASQSVIKITTPCDSTRISRPANVFSAFSVLPMKDPDSVKVTWSLPSYHYYDLGADTMVRYDSVLIYCRTDSQYPSLSGATITGTQLAGFEVDAAHLGVSNRSVGGVNCSTTYYFAAFIVNEVPVGYSNRYSVADIFRPAPVTPPCSIAIERTVPAIPAVFSYGQPRPNPFNPSTMINYQLPMPEHVRLDVFNISGNLVETLVNENKPAGYYTAAWNSQSSPSGIYYFKLKAGNFKGLSKGMLIK